MDGLTYRACGPMAGIVDCQPHQCLPISRALRATGGFTEVVPGERSVFVAAKHPIDRAEVLTVARANLDGPPASLGRLVEIPVRYDGEDLPHVAAATGLSVEAVIDMHSSAVFTAAFSGFAPGFVYCTGLPAPLQLPRRPEPRVQVPAGAVAIADAYSAIYPMASPGGWHLLGVTDARMFDLERETASLIQPGDTVRYVRVPR